MYAKGKKKHSYYLVIDKSDNHMVPRQKFKASGMMVQYQGLGVLALNPGFVMS